MFRIALVYSIAVLINSMFLKVGTPIYLFIYVKRYYEWDCFPDSFLSMSVFVYWKYTEFCLLLLHPSTFMTIFSFIC